MTRKWQLTITPGLLPPGVTPEVFAQIVRNNRLYLSIQEPGTWRHVIVRPAGEVNGVSVTDKIITCSGHGDIEVDVELETGLLLDVTKHFFNFFTYYVDGPAVLGPDDVSPDYSLPGRWG